MAAKKTRLGKPQLRERTARKKAISSKPTTRQNTKPGKSKQTKSLRQTIDAILERAQSDRSFAKRLMQNPQATLQSFGLNDPWEIVTDAWGIGPVGDCGHDTCRLTKECGWTVCGKTTNACAAQEDALRERMDDVLEQLRTDSRLKQKLVKDPLEGLKGLGFDATVARYVADAWGMGPTGDCGHDTCRLTKECGWTVCGKTTNACAQEEDSLRGRMDQVLEQVRADRSLRQKLIDKPVEALTGLGFPADTARYVADAWGIGPAGDCGHDTCRNTDKCGWTVCGKTTNSCAQDEDRLRVRMDEVLARVGGDSTLRQKLIKQPSQTLASLGFDAATVRYVADAWGIGPTGDCGHDTCRFTSECGWTVCGKTTNDCAQGLANK